VTDDRIDPTEEVPEADLLEQRATLERNDLTDLEPESVPVEDFADPVDPADRLEQLAAVPDEPEDDYPHD
jgi:hypothetical protein